MIDILNKYKERLINLSSRNRSLVLKKLYKKRSFDLSRLTEFNKDICKQMLNFIISRGKGRQVILEDPYKKRTELIKDVEKEINQLYLNEINEIKLVSDKDSLTSKQEKIKEKYNELLNNKINEINKCIEKMIDFSTSLNYLYREINATEKETGRYELYIGYPFVEGKLQDSTFVRAPLLLFPVKILKEKNKWYLENINDEEIKLNKVFILAFSKYNEIRLPDFQTEFENLEHFGDNICKGLLTYLEDNKISIQDIGDKHISKFNNYTNENIPDYLVGELILKNHLVLGQFPLSNSIYNDYKKLENKVIENNILKKLLGNSKEDELTGQDLNELDTENELSISEKDNYFISSLDYSQEKAINKAKKTDNLVIYGPPGTGKSQTIANIISDALANSKRILMVSQKRAALDVIYNRLADVKSKISLIHDANKDKKDFYKKVSSYVEDIVVDNKLNIKNEIFKKAEYIDEQIKILDDIGQVLHAPRDFGLSLQQMYSKSKSINSIEDPRYKKFKTYKKQNKFSNRKYNELLEALSNINDSLIDDYINYREMISNNSLFEYILPTFDSFEALDIYENIDKCNETISKFYEHFQNNPKFTKLTALYKQKNYAVKGEDLEELAVKINKEENSELLRPLNDGRWWSIKYWLEYNKNKKKEILNKKEFSERKEIILQELKQLNKVIQNGLNSLRLLNDSFKDIFMSQLRESIFNGHEVSDIFNKIVNAIDDYDKYKKLKLKIDVLSKLEKDLLDYSYTNSKNKQEFIDILYSIIEFEILIRIRNIEKSHEEKNKLMHYSRHKEITERIKELMIEKNKLTPKLIVETWNEIFSKHIDDRLFREFRRQANKKRKLLPIRKYIEEFREMVFDLFPCWLLSPETVSEIFPLIEGMFDVIIFDEASQMFVENSIPTIYRGKKIIVAGDDKQLKPTSIFKSKYDEVDEDEMTVDTAAALEEESLLDLAKVNFDDVHLNYHYRSEFDELINFSNYAFYGGRLQVSPNVIKNSKYSKPIERIKVNGKWIDRKNQIEAEKVVDLVYHILNNRKNNETIGIITFNVNQKDLIEDLLENKADKDPNFKAKYSAEINRKDGDEDISLFVKNIENVQGDERDIIIFSIGYAKNENGRVSVNFGALSQDGGENRLNVAISRAKRKIYVVTSIEPEELRVENTKNIGPKLFKKYLQYVREISNGNITEAKTILNSLVDTRIESKNEVKFDSDFEMQVYESLVRLGYNVEAQVGVSGYKIDLAIYDPKTLKYILGIECDGAAFHSSKTARERDIHRQRYLESRGWKIVRIWSRDWWKNPKSEIDKIDSLAKTLLNKTKKDINTNETHNIIELKYERKKDKKYRNTNFINENYDIDDTRKTNDYKKDKTNYIKITNELYSNNSKIVASYGDTVVLEDTKNNETFEVQIEDNPYNKQLMSEIEKKVITRKIGDRINFKGYEYIISKIIKINNQSKNSIN